MDSGYDAPSPSRSASSGSPDFYEGEGWVAFAGIMIAIVGVLNFIYGIAAISNSHFYVREATYIVSGLNTWGWVLMITGIIQFCAAIAIFGHVEWGRWIGILTASVNAIIQLIFIPAYPFGSLALFALDILIIYGLVAYGGRQNRVV
ncbi:MAG TPA: hypothetical protein VNX67_00080 [Solirubrobacteraceae bacterium]|jgi:hypothetical protein|nr:hypothetical protein [Solirubrobacteraceae bacterium]